MFQMAKLHCCVEIRKSSYLFTSASLLFFETIALSLMLCVDLYVLYGFS